MKKLFAVLFISAILFTGQAVANEKACLNFGTTIGVDLSTACADPVLRAAIVRCSVVNFELPASSACRILADQSCVMGVMYLSLEQRKHQ